MNSKQTLTSGQNYSWQTLLLGLFMALASTIGSQAATIYTYTNTVGGASGLWSTTANWNPNGTPGGAAGDTVFLTNSAATAYTNTLNATPANSLSALTISNASGQARLIVTNAILAVTNLTLGNGGVLQIDNGGVVTNPSAVLWNGANGVITINSNGNFSTTPTSWTLSSMTGLVTSADSQGGIWNFNNKYFAAQNYCKLTVNNVTLTNIDFSYNNLLSMIISNGARYSSAHFSYDGTLQIGGLGAASVFRYGTSGFYLGGNNGTRNDSVLVITNATVIGNSSLRIGQPTSNNTATIAANGTLDLNNALVVGDGGCGNVLTVNGGTVTNLSGSAPAALDIGAATGANSNRVVLNSGSKVYLSGGFVRLGAAGGSYNSLVMSNATLSGVTNNYHRIGSGAGSTGNTVYMMANSLWNCGWGGSRLYVGNAGINNEMVVDASIVTNIGDKVIVGGADFSGTTTTGNRLILSNGASLYEGNQGIWLSYVLGCTNNMLQVGGLGAPSFCSDLGFGVQVGRSGVGGGFNTLIVTNATLQTVGNSVVGGNASNTAYVKAGGYWNLQGSAVTVGDAAASVNNTLSVSGGGVLEAASLITSVGSGAGNVITNDGGVYQFNTATPTITPNTGSIGINNGAVSFRGITTADVLCNRGSGPLITSKMAWSGTNAFRLNNATNNATLQAYTFTDTLGATNFARLELLNGSLYQGGDVTIGAHGTLLVSNGVSRIASNLTFAATATFAVDLSSTNGYGALITGSNVTLNGCALALNLGSAPVSGSSFQVITNTAGLFSGSFATPSQVLTVNNTNYILRVSTGANGASVSCNIQTRGMCLTIE